MKPQKPLNCDGCGVCCEFLIFQYDRPLNEEEKRFYELRGIKVDYSRVIVEIPCKAYDVKEKNCSIYPTRPKSCKEFELGGQLCMACRAIRGVGIAKSNLP